MKILFESLSDILNIMKSKNEFRIQIISREDIKIFKLFLDSSNLDYHINYWNNYLVSSNQKIIHVYTSSEDFNPNYKKVILFNPVLDNKFIQICFRPTYVEKMKFIRLKYKKTSKIDIIIDAYKNSAIHEICDKIENKCMMSMVESFDYTESLILFSMCKCSKLTEIIKEIRNIDKNVNNKFILKMKINGLVNRKVILFKNNIYKLNISLEALEGICKKIDLDIKKL